MIRILVWVLIMVAIISMIRSCGDKGDPRIQQEREVTEVVSDVDEQKQVDQEEGIDESLTPEDKLYRLTGERIDPVDAH
jgi:hypothetical protein